MRSRRYRSWAGAVLAVLLLPLAAACANIGKTTSAGGGGAASFKGKTVHFVVSYGPGGGYDQIARAIAPYLEKELGATVVVENRAGAGGLLAANEVYAAKPDGLTFGFFSGQGQAGATLGGAEGVKFELTKFSYVARLAADPRVLTVGAKSGLKTIDDVRSASTFRFASSGPGGSEHIDATVLFPILGIKGKIVTGYKGSKETELAVTSGDTDGTSGTLGTRLSPIKSGDQIPVLTIGAKRAKELPDVPALLELNLQGEDRAVAEAHTVMQDMGRMVLAPPNVPKDTLKALRDAFRAASQNPEFLASMKKADQEIDFLDGEKALAVAEKVLQAPLAYKSLLKQAYHGQ